MRKTKNETTQQVAETCRFSAAILHWSRLAHSRAITCDQSRGSCSVVLTKGRSTMPRESKPWKRRGWFWSNIGGQDTKLCRDDQPVTEAKRILTIKKAEWIKTRPVESGETTVSQ